MNTSTSHRIAALAASIVATFAVVNLIADYALPPVKPAPLILARADTGRTTQPGTAEAAPAASRNAR
jgi:hypothetical protein